MKAKFCPKCGNTDLIMVTGGEVGKLKCKKCEYEGIFPEREHLKAYPEKSFKKISTRGKIKLKKQNKK
jgi:DNA-directed RNA polymerase subunit M/transcription elongation factor TFIIS|tara:strand:- start:250 stop:453 length:204 start_codon:yes stop_codon:yes gene_type:complete